MGFFFYLSPALRRIGLIGQNVCLVAGVLLLPDTHSAVLPLGFTGFDRPTLAGHKALPQQSQPCHKVLAQSVPQLPALPQPWLAVHNVPAAPKSLAMVCRATRHASNRTIQQPSVDARSAYLGDHAGSFGSQN